MSSTIFSSAASASVRGALVALPLLVTCFACGSGGTDPVRQVGAYGENPGPGSNNVYRPITPIPETPRDTPLRRLCINACANQFAKCDGAPPASALNCDAMCSSAPPTPIHCVDELTTLYTCIGTTNSVCESRRFVGCKAQEDALDECIRPDGGASSPAGSGTACVRDISRDRQCEGLGRSSFFDCSASAPPSPNLGCLQVGSREYCCS